MACVSLANLAVRFGMEGETNKWIPTMQAPPKARSLHRQS
jgi:hypothetical protein